MTSRLDSDTLAAIAETVDRALAKTLPGLMRETFQSEFERIGFSTSTEDSRREVRKDAEYIRTLRLSHEAGRSEIKKGFVHFVASIFASMLAGAAAALLAAWEATRR